jgi:hypothetical protein
MRSTKRFTAAMILAAVATLGAPHAFAGDIGTGKAGVTLGDSATKGVTLGDSATKGVTLGDSATKGVTLGDVLTGIITFGFTISS